MRLNPGLTLSATTALTALLTGCAAPGPAPMAVADAAPPQIPMRDFFRNIDRGYFRVSGDGRRLGFMQPATGDDGKSRRLNIFVQSLDGSRPVGEPKQLTFESARDISNYFWKGGDTLLYTKDFGGDENFHVVAVDASSGKITDLTPYAGVRAAVLDDLPEDPTHILVQHNQRDKRAFDVYRIDVKTGAQTGVASNPGNIVGWSTDHPARYAWVWPATASTTPCSTAPAKPSPSGRCSAPTSAPRSTRSSSMRRTQSSTPSATAGATSRPWC